MALELNITKNTNTAIVGTAGKYYPRVEYKGTYSLKQLAKYISKKSTTFSPGEIVGMLTDLVVSIRELTLLGYVVKIDDLGLFKATVEGNGLTLQSGAKVSAGVGRQREDEELAQEIALQQYAVGAVKMIMQATGDTTISEMTREAQLAFTSKAKELVASLTGNSASSQNGTGSDASDLVVLEAPVISGDTPFSSTTEVTISAQSGAIIYYTSDGSTPTEESTRYTGALTLSESATIKAIAVLDGESSEVASKAFTKSSGGGGGLSEG